ncbi:hybrid sensor histidine kinase/response regulator [Okeania sp. KiyG1]|uniref:hybrid sensor histidine kinase/response regulator n=1 Tax=Okeania sp. KiyG1 TaxID=2720165 RepID=UPI0019A7C42B|nr:hybrid sensor histidine kinase/response regulator [Okeania sp. KiyG1]GFZ89793.1 hypothetical protein CYANOKiyG1_00020 [Okeania sp. KiyG1]
MALQIRKSLLVQLTSYFSILSVLTIGIVAIAAYFQAKQGISKSVIDRLTVAIALKSSDLKQWVDNQIQDVFLSSQQPIIRENLATILTTEPSEPNYQQADRAIREYLNHWTSIKSNTRDMRITTNASYIVFDLQNPELKGRYRPNGDPATFLTPEMANTVVPNFYISPKTGKATITFATPIFDTENIRMGALAVDLRLGNIDAIIRNNTGLGKTAETYLVGRGKKGAIFISGEKKNETISDEEISSVGIDRAIEHQSGYGLYKNYAGVPVVGVYRWLPDQNLALLAEISQKEAFAPARQLARNITLIGLLSAGVLLIVVYLLCQQIVRPIVTISRAAESLAAGDLNQTVPVLAKNEVGLLAQTFNQMAAQLKVLVEDLEKRVQERTAELAIATEKAEAANQAKSAFIANMSHELRSPLNAILGFAQIMTRSQTLPQEHLENVSIISRSGEHLLTLINNVLDLSKIEAGRITLNQKNFDLHRLLNDIEDMLHFKAQEKDLQLLVEQNNDVPQYICTDEVKLRQVLINIINNGIKFTSQGGISVRVAQKYPPSNPTQILFEVEDTGAGIAPEEVDKLFEAFTQTETGKQAQEGTGLGLPISRKFVQLMGGDIHVTSQINQGTIFSFEIEANIVSEDEIVDPQVPQRRIIALEPNQPRYRILIVDDKPLNRQLLIKLLSPLGFELKEAVNGQQAIEIWDDWQPRLIWMDMRMPVMDGYEATQKIKATTKGQATTIIALTASVLEEEKVVVLSAGCDDFMRKPFRSEDIFKKMEEYLGVRYVYEEIESKPQQKKKEETLESIQEKVSVLSEELKQQLRDALLTGNLAGIAHTITTIRQSDNSLAEAIQKYCDGFEYEKILNWLGH